MGSGDGVVPDCCGLLLTTGPAIAGIGVDLAVLRLAECGLHATERSIVRVVSSRTCLANELDDGIGREAGKAVVGEQSQRRGLLAFDGRRRCDRLRASADKSIEGRRDVRSSSRRSLGAARRCVGLRHGHNSTIGKFGDAFAAEKSG